MGFASKYLRAQKYMISDFYAQKFQKDGKSQISLERSIRFSTGVTL